VVDRGQRLNTMKHAATLIHEIIQLTIDAWKMQLACNVQWGGQHPDHTLAEWRHDVACGDTTLGYWAWVVTCVEAAEEAEEALSDMDETTMAYIDDDGAPITPPENTP
jgi:hypothetical protein